MNRHLLFVLIIALTIPFSGVGTELEAVTNTRYDTTRLRVIMSSDFPPFPVTNSDPDDVQSMVRFMLYTNEFDVEGLIASAGTFDMVASKQNILDVIDRYDQVDENLRTHDSLYPTADYLRLVTYQGMGNEGPISIQWGCDKQPWSDIIGDGRDSEASDAIIAAADKDDPRPIYIGVWGGPREVAQAIWKVQNTRSQAELDAFISKLRVYLIACQDATHGWLMDNFPNLFIIESRSTYGGMFGTGSQAWVYENIINNHGPLCAIYEPSAMCGDGVCEGDTPTFLYLVSANMHPLGRNRLGNDPEDPTQPSWGGQYDHSSGTNHYVDGPGGSTISMWADDFQAEFQERADWCLDESSVDEKGCGELPKCFELGQNYPNPFNPTTQIEYSVPKSGYITLKAYNILGQEIASLYEGFHQPGNYTIAFDGSKLSSGVYLYQMKAHNFSDIKRMLLLK